MTERQLGAREYPACREAAELENAATGREAHIEPLSYTVQRTAIVFKSIIDREVLAHAQRGNWESVGCQADEVSMGCPFGVFRERP